MDLRQVFKMVKVLVTRRDNNYDENFNRFARRNSEGERWHCRIFIIGGSFFFIIGSLVIRQITVVLSFSNSACVTLKKCHLLSKKARVEF